MQPITSANLAAHHADQSARIAAGTLSAASLHAPAVTAIRNTEDELTQFFLENPGCTIEDAYLAGFDDRQLERWAKSARRRAARRWHG